MSRIFRKLLLSFFVAIICVLSIVPVASAQSSATPGPWYNQNYNQWSGKVFDTSNPNEIFGERYTYAQVNWIINSLIAVITGPQISNCVSKGDLAAIGECMKPLAPGTAMSGGAIGGLASITNTLLNARPASGIGYIRETASRLHVIPEAYAQVGGIGFNTLTPVQTLWGVVRNISYALMVIVIIAMAFMIMFRVKINPQVVITIQSALPKVVIALVLITFSYAIAGFLVDLMYVIVGAFAGMIKIGGTTISNSDVPYLFTQLVSGNALVSIVIGILLFTIILAVAAFLLPIGGTLTLPVIGTSVGILGSIVLLVGVVFLLVILFRLFFLMVRTACLTVLLIVISPLMILMGAITNSGGFGSWLRTLAANLAVYPTVIIMVFLSHYFFWGWFVGGFLTGVLSALTPFNTFNVNVWNMGTSNPGGDTAPVINLPGMPIRTNVIGFFVSFIILFLIPKAAEIVQSIITGKAFSYGSAFGEALGGPVGLGIGAYEAYRSPERAAFEAQIKNALAPGAPGLTPPQQAQLRASQVMQQARGFMGKIFK